MILFFQSHSNVYVQACEAKAKVSTSMAVGFSRVCLLLLEDLVV